MKIYKIILFIFLMLISTFSIAKQDSFINIHVEDVTFFKLFELIESQSELIFIFASEKQFKVEKFDFEGEVEEVIDYLVEEFDFKIRRIGNKVIIKSEI
ncbi:hypothetical protein [Flammeovirga aprica]|uniref:Secretin/TonB short N-terminal domain-containing protein n=1 Tax=Flammeovirga aprica JL-4 TaxID=694437 RepID=A0A7X9RR71_9BACT|nr:hypothetical protein [Flammeovirga aprica]NME67533.1 hypothetical protein [Flammeovirga aprica JL-4]